jgi:UDP-N-acetylglucosamine diphosphorylase / glucose-1-phosphate thymidylyltransferase / UDP-N-acetylgalactosamine diphosphorylase / glucosamine-1-phosphate N-acetyltransferase / galactosamine-1-phosphate N-acetyltransferase
MGDITQEIPKPMLPVKGRPMLEHIIERLEESGISRFLVVVGYQGETVQRHFEKTNPNVEFVRQNPVNGTGSAALLSKGFCGGEPFLLIYGDILCDVAEYRRCSSILADNPNTAASLAVKAVDDPWQGAAVYEEHGVITRILEKPPKGTSTTRWNSGGFYCFRPVVFDYLAKLEPSIRGEYELTSAIDAMLADGLELRISPIEGPWRDVGRPEDLAAVNS